MATVNNNLSEYDLAIPSAKDFRFGIVVQEMEPIHHNKYKGAYNTLIEQCAGRSITRWSSGATRS
jgi:hypothetical protein